MTYHIIRILALLALTPNVVWALDHDNLDPNRPIAMEDAYVVPKGEMGVEGGVVMRARRQGRTGFVFQPQIIYGAFNNTQLEFMTNLLTEPTSVVGPDKSGNFTLGGLYNFNTETMNLPAFAGRLEVGFPTGVRARGLETAVTGVMTKTIDRMRVHLNVGYSLLESPQGQERKGQYRLIAAVSYPLGYPTRFRETLIVDVFTRQSDLMGQRNPSGLEMGIRHQFSSRVVLDAGIGSEVYGPADRSIFFSTIGISVGF